MRCFATAATPTNTRTNTTHSAAQLPTNIRFPVHVRSRSPAAEQAVVCRPHRERARHSRLDGREGHSDPHPVLSLGKEEQGQRQGPAAAGDKAEPCTTPVSPGAWLRPASVHHSPSESQVPAEAQVASILHGYGNPRWSPALGSNLSPSTGCETSHRSLNLSGLDFLIHHWGEYIYIYISITGNKSLSLTVTESLRTEANTVRRYCLLLALS